jgi:hypothetical protein
MKEKMSIKEILIWLFIFIIGSLIVTFLINPNSFESFKENLISISRTNQSQGVNIIKLIPYEMEEYNFFRGIYRSCASLEAMGEANEISNVKQKTCREACGIRDMNYYSTQCEKNLLICFCKNQEVNKNVKRR